MKIELTDQDRKELERCLADSVFRLQAEYHLVKDNDLPSELRQSPLLLKYRRPTGWRLKVWKQLIATVFKGLAEFKPGKDVHSCGVVMGVFSRMMQTLSSLDEVDSRYLETAVPNPDQLGLTEEETTQRFERLASILDPEKFSALVEKEKPEELGQCYTGFGEGLDLVGSIDKDGRIVSKRSTDATPVYLFLLIYGDFLEKQRSVDEVYTIFQSGNGGNEDNPTPETFKQICNRIGFTGASYRRRKRRINRQAKKP